MIKSKIVLLKAVTNQVPMLGTIILISATPRTAKRSMSDTLRPCDDGDDDDNNVRLLIRPYITRGYIMQGNRS